MNILFISLGCDKNLVDTEVMLGILAQRGHQMVDDENEADIIMRRWIWMHYLRERRMTNCQIHMSSLYVILYHLIVVCIGTISAM